MSQVLTVSVVCNVKPDTETRLIKAQFILLYVERTLHALGGKPATSRHIPGSFYVAEINTYLELHNRFVLRFVRSDLTGYSKYYSYLT